MFQGMWGCYLQPGNYRQFYISDCWAKVKCPPAALTGMNDRAACPGWALGYSWVPSDMKTQQRRRQLQAAGEEEGNAGWVSPGRNHTLTQGKRWFSCR